MWLVDLDSYLILNDVYRRFETGYQRDTRCCATYHNLHLFCDGQILLMCPGLMQLKQFAFLYELSFALNIEFLETTAAIQCVFSTVAFGALAFGCQGGCICLVPSCLLGLCSTWCLPKITPLRGWVNLATVSGFKGATSCSEKFTELRICKNISARVG